MGERAHCETCGRSFKNHEGLESHNVALHGFVKEEKKEDFSLKIPKKAFMWAFGIVGSLVLIVWLFVSLTPSVSGSPLDPGSDPFLGNPDAKVTIVEFSDYECPVCQRFWSTTLDQLKKEYVDTGKVKFVYRDFPLTQSHPMAMASAEAAECVFQQGGNDAYFEYHDILFGNQYLLSVSNLKAWAKDIGYDIDSCLDSGDSRKEVQQDFFQGQQAGARGTPTFFINGKAISGAQSFSVFRQLIESEL